MSSKEQIILDPEDIQEFQQLAKEEWGINLTLEQAKEQAERMIKFGKLLTFDTKSALEIQTKKEENLSK